METTIAKGQQVKIKPEWCDTPEDRDMRYLVIEDNGDRCLIEAICSMKIRPTEKVSKHMIEPA